MISPEEMAELVARPAPVALPGYKTVGYVPHTSFGQKVEYTHEALIDLILLNPQAPNTELARHFGCSSGHIGMLRSSDAFQAKLAMRRASDITPLLREELEARMKAVANRSLQVLQEKLAAPAADISETLALKAAEFGAKGLGMGGFGAAPQAPPPPASGRLEELAKRLTDLIPDRTQGASDVQAREILETPRSRE